MAKHTVLVDDLDGSFIEEGGGASVKFALDGIEYSIDLSSENMLKLNEALAPFIAVARQDFSESLSSPSGPEVKISRRKRAAQLATIRSWAEENGKPVSRRGRISRDVMQAYENRTDS